MSKTGMISQYILNVFDLAYYKPMS